MFIIYKIDAALPVTRWYKIHGGRRHSAWPCPADFPQAQWFRVRGLVTEGQRRGQVHPTHKQFSAEEAYPRPLGGLETGEEGRGVSVPRDQQVLGKLAVRAKEWMTDRGESGTSTHNH